MCTALAPRIGYDNASAVAKAAYREGRTVREVAHELDGLPSPEVVRKLGPPASEEALQKYGGFPSKAEVDRLLDPRAQTDRGSGGGGAGG